MNNYLSRLKEKLWLFSIIATVFGAFFAIYVEYFKESKPDLNYIIVSNSNILDIKENLSKLDVIYQGESLNKNKRNLKLFTIKVANQGKATIYTNYYDPNDPLGIYIKNGQIAETPTIEKASSNYLKTKLTLNNIKENSVYFSRVIIEPEEYFLIKLLVLYKIGEEPIIKSLGKIADVNKGTSINSLISWPMDTKRSKNKPI